MRFSKRKLHFFVFLLFYVEKIETAKTLASSTFQLDLTGACPPHLVAQASLSFTQKAACSSQLSMVAELVSLQFLGCTIGFLLVATFTAAENLARRGRKLGSSKLSSSASDGPSWNC